MSEITVGSEWLNKCDGLEATVKSVGSECVGFTQIINGKKYFYNHTVEEFKEYYRPKPNIDATFDDDIALQTFGELPAKRMRLIGIAGKARSGKDTAAKYLLNKLGGEWYIASFADPMKAMLNAIDIDCSDEAKDLSINQYGLSTRRMLQTLGTEWGRDRNGNNFWLDVFSRSNAGQCVIVPDVRFENEADLIREHGLLICIEGRGGIEGDHASERKLDFNEDDIFVDNRGSLSELYARLDSIDLTSE